MKFIYKVYATHKTFETIMNYVFKFDLAQQKEGIDEVDEEEEDSNKMSHSQVKILGQSDISEALAKNLEFNFWDNMRLRTYKFFTKFNITKSCCQCLGKVQPKVTLAYMAQKKIQKDLDLANIVQKLYEIDFLKLYLFDDQQLILFNSFCCPILNDNIRNEQEKKKEYRRLKPTKTSVLDKFDPEKQDQQQDSAYSSNIPIEGRLSKYSRFFNAQLRFENISELAEAYHKMDIKKHNDDGEKQKLFKFINYNRTLIKAVNILKSKLKQPKFLDTVNKMMMTQGHNQLDVKSYSSSIRKNEPSQKKSSLFLKKVISNVENPIQNQDPLLKNHLKNIKQSNRIRMDRYRMLETQKQELRNYPQNKVIKIQLFNDQIKQ